MFTTGDLITYADYTAKVLEVLDNNDLLIEVNKLGTHIVHKEKCIMLCPTL